jgi:hypothetical protein
MLLAVYPTGQTIGNGQLLTLVLPPLLTGLLLLRRSDRGLEIDLLVALLLLVALVKPTASLPFLPVACVLSRGIRAVTVTCLGYVALTLVAASYQSAGLTRSCIGGSTPRGRLQHVTARTTTPTSMPGLQASGSRAGSSPSRCAFSWRSVGGPGGIGTWISGC